MARVKTGAGILLVGGASLLALAAAARAQEAGALVLDPIVVQGEGGTGGFTAPVTGFVAETAGTALKSDTPLLETPRSVSVITTDQIRDQGAQTMGQALGYSSGVLAEPYGADPRFDSPQIRGFDARNAQYLNGLKIMRSSGAPSYEVYGLERVEVLKGPASVLYGSGSPAGIINQVQKHAQPLDFGEVGAGFGTHGDASGFADVNRAVSDTFAFRLTAALRDTEEDISALTNTRGYLGAAARWEITPLTTIDLLASYQKDSPITPAGIPYGLTGADDRALRDFYIGDTDFDDSDRRMTNLGYEFSHEFEGGWKLSQSARYQKFDWDYQGFYASGLDGDTISRGANWQDENTWTANADTRLAGAARTGAVTHDLLLGLDLRHYDDRTTTEFGTATPVVLGDATTQSATVGEPWYTSTDDLTLDQIGLYGQDELSLGNWRGSLALRHDWAKQEGTGTTNFAGTTNIDQKDEATTGRAGLLYAFESGVSPYVSYATSFDPETGTDIDGAALKPTEGRQWEGGVKFQPLGMDALITAAVFDIEQTNVSVSVTEGGVTGTRQIGKVKSRGFELEATAALDAHWDLRAAYTYLDAEQVGGANDGRAPANTPGNTASLWATYGFAGRLDGLSLGGGLRYVGERYGDNANAYELDPATLLDASARYTFENGVSAALNVTNLTDEVYLANCGGFGCYFGQGRRVMATMSYAW